MVVLRGNSAGAGCRAARCGGRGRAHSASEYRFHDKHSVHAPHTKPQYGRSRRRRMNRLAPIRTRAERTYGAVHALHTIGRVDSTRRFGGMSTRFTPSPTWTSRVTPQGSDTDLPGSAGYFAPHDPAIVGRCQAYFATFVSPPCPDATCFVLVRHSSRGICRAVSPRLRSPRRLASPSSPPSFTPPARPSTRFTPIGRGHRGAPGVPVWRAW